MIGVKRAASVNDTLDEDEVYGFSFHLIGHKRLPAGTIFQNGFLLLLQKVNCDDGASSLSVLPSHRLRT
jgi:hypothetical protein